MNNRNIKRMISSLRASIGLALTLTVVSAYAAGREGNGGAGVQRSGTYMTFYSAGLYTEPAPKNQEDLPGLNELVNFLEQFPYLSDQTKFRFINALLPSKTHEYYKAKEDRFDTTTLKRLLAEFNRVTGQPLDQLELFAITDTNLGKTFLLPSFYRLSPQEQMAILFHETFWILNPKADYSTVVAAEMAFQAVLTQPSNMNRVLDLLNYFGDRKNLLIASIKSDLSSGALTGLVNNQMIPLQSLLGNEFFSCVKRANNRGSTCFDILRLNIYRLSQKYPQSLLIKYLYQRKDMIGKMSFMKQGTIKYYGHCTLFAGKDVCMTGNANDILWETSHEHTSFSILKQLNQFIKIDYSQCSLNLSMKSGYTEGAAYIPVSCQNPDEDIFDVWLSSDER